jgi:ABC-type antimicrobial peptide transport system permease subunit
MYTFINLLGLAMSLTCVIIIARYVYSELKVDGFNSRLDRICVSTQEMSINPGTVRYSGIFNPNNEKTFVDLSKHPGVEKHALFIPLDKEQIMVGEETYNTKLLVVDSVFLQILDYPATAGADNIYRPEEVLITETFAAKVFGREDPVGRALFYPTLNRTLTVAGVLRTPAHKSSLSFDLLVYMQNVNDWSRVPQSFLLLHPGSDRHDINRQYGDFMEMAAWGYGIRYQLFPCREVYFDRQISDYGLFVHGNLTYVFILMSIGVLLLLIGVVNYINIHSVVMMRRNRELGVKKVFGAGGFTIFMQLLLENLLPVVLALAVAFLLAETLQPFVEKSLGIRQYPSLRFDLWLALALTVVLPGALNVAPFLRYRYFSPVRSLRAVTVGGSKSLLPQQFFLCFQSFLTMGLLSVSLFFVKQLDFMLHADLGFRTRDIIQVPFLNRNVNFSLPENEWKAQREKRKTITDELKQKLDASTLLEYWSFGEFPTGNLHEFEFKSSGGEPQKVLLTGADETWFKLYDIRLLDGRLWDNTVDNDFSYDLIVNEAALRQFDIADYREGELQPSRRIWWSSDRGEEMKTNPPYRIVGVVKDFHTKHLSSRQAPVAIYFSEPWRDYPVVASFAPEHRREVIEWMRGLHDEMIGGEFAYTFIEDEIAALYLEDKKVSVICTVFTGIAILIGALGVLGVSLFDIRRRRKEIAIRKVNGATITDIIRLLLKKYLAVQAIAFVLATPVALFVIHRYLDNFAFRAPVSWWIFAVALTVTVAISLLTLLFQAGRASRENPADVVKTE